MTWSWSIWRTGIFPEYVFGLVPEQVQQFLYSKAHAKALPESGAIEGPLRSTEESCVVIHT